jgi:hypothetical protein
MKIWVIPIAFYMTNSKKLNPLCPLFCISTRLAGFLNPVTMNLAFVI